MERNQEMTYTVVTTFNARGLDLYAQRMIDTFCVNWPAEVKLFLYPESCQPTIPQDASNIIVKDLDTVSELMAFKTKWLNVPKANGDVRADPVRSKRRDAGKGFKWDAVRFSHKVYAIFDCAEIAGTDTLIWMDADTICHSAIDMSTIQRLIPADKDLCYLGRKGKFSECGLYSMNLRSQNIKMFLNEFQRMYDHAENGIFQLDEWHDSFVFDAVRNKIKILKQHNWSEKLGDLRPSALRNSPGEGHPLINSEWGAYLDHLKGDDRKRLGKSKPTDIKVARTESYWTT
jgi:hypothetical protein